MQQLTIPLACLAFVPGVCLKRVHPNYNRCAAEKSRLFVRGKRVRRSMNCGASVDDRTG